MAFVIAAHLPLCLRGECAFAGCCGVFWLSWHISHCASDASVSSQVVEVLGTTSQFVAIASPTPAVLSHLTLTAKPRAPVGFFFLAPLDAVRVLDLSDAIHNYGSYTSMACIVMACAVMARVVMIYIVMAYIVMAFTVMVDVVTASRLNIF